MLLTTEPTITGRQYTILQVVHACVYADIYKTSAITNPKPTPYKVDEGIETALGQLAVIASQFQADAVIAIQHNVSIMGATACITVIGTAIKF